MKTTLLAALMAFAIHTSAAAATLQGRVTDWATGEAIIGAAVMIEGTSTGVATDFDGNYSLGSLPVGTCRIMVSCISYTTQTFSVSVSRADGVLTRDISLSTDDRQIDEVAVVARKNLEAEQTLMMERRQASAAIENIGAREMAVKGVGNVADGVSKLTGISIAQAGQLIVRGLGDRYSTTSLNGLPIASPNPDNKLIPLDIFPTSTVSNITVSKVYEADYYADYSGAHVDIGTRESTGADFVNLQVGVGGNVGTLGADFYSMDRKGTLWGQNRLKDRVTAISKSEFESYVRTTDVFGTTFDVSRQTARPDLSLGLGAGHTWQLGTHSLNVLVAGSVDNDLRTIEDAYALTLEAGGNVLSRFGYDSYANTLRLAALANVGLSLRTADRIAGTFFFARNASDTYMLRQGIDYEDHLLTGSNNVSHIYRLLCYQLLGHHELGGIALDWSGSYAATSGDEPDRRQVMFLADEQTGRLSLFKLNRQETMRYFGALDEDEANGRLQAALTTSGCLALKAGMALRHKKRDYEGTRFYYNLNAINPDIESVYHHDSYLGQAAIADGSISVERNMQPKDRYSARHTVAAGYVTAELRPVEPLLVSLGLRFEHSEQAVDYSTDGGRAMTARLKCDDIFPAVNIKYAVSHASSLRLSLSRTVTRPSFIEMAPFLYQESYGAAQIRGNADLDNGYNYNIDLRFERITDAGDLLAATAYCKLLHDPIERIQRLSGGSAVHSFYNADNGRAAGIELEARKKLSAQWQAGINASLMYTNVKLPEGGSYTNDQRALQGASPYLGNADVTWHPTFADGSGLTMALLYNLQGPRIHAVGIAGLGDVEQKPVHMLNLNAQYSTAEHWQIGLKLTDLLARPIRFEQEVPQTGATPTVEEFKRGTNVELSLKYRF